jgi:glycosyltransferase involved in cell wall biosynthesis
MSSSTLSAIVIAKNEAANLPDCLTALKFCSEVVLVVDHGSTDQTARIGQSFGARVILTDHWPGFGLQKQQALDAALSEWVLSIDADERVTPELAKEIYQAIQTERADGFYIKRRTQFLGKWMSHGGWYPDRVLRLARRSHAAFDPSPVHEKMMVKGRLAELTHPLLHYSYRSIEDVLSKQKSYALIGAEKKILSSRTTNTEDDPPDSTKNASTKLTPGVGRALFKSIWTFTRLFFFQLGFLDGRHGLIAALAKSQETFWKYLATAWPGDRSR